MAADRRSPEEIRRALSEERAELTDALAALREDVQSARRIPMMIGGAVLAGLVAVAAVKAARRRGG
jgi:hypothetical protein